MSISSKNPKRIRQLLWSQNFREQTQHLSVVPRPQCIRALWMKSRKKEK